MQSDWSIDEKLDLSELLEQSLKRASGDTKDLSLAEKMRLSLRRSMQQLASRFWQEYLHEAELRGLGQLLTPACPRPEYCRAGGFVRLVHFDPQKEVSLDGRQLLLASAGETGFYLNKDESFDGLRGLVDEVTGLFTAAKVLLWDVVGEIGDERLTIPQEPPAENGEDAEKSAACLELRAVRVPGLALFLRRPSGEWVVPGLDSVKKKLASEERPEVAVDAKTPQDLVRLMLKSLAEDDFDSFLSMWTSEAQIAHHRRRFSQFRRTFADSQGKVGFERYDDDYSPNARMVRVWTKRELSSGAVGRNPLTAVKEEGRWVFTKGTI